MNIEDITISDAKKLSAMRVRRRSFLVVLLFLTVGILSTNLTINLFENGLSLLEGCYIFLSTIAFLWIAQSFWTSTVGFAFRLFFPRNAAMKVSPVAAGLDVKACPVGRTAIVMPIYNEDPEMVFQGMEQTLRSVLATGHGNNYDFFVLSDTTKDEIAAQENILAQELLHRYALQGRFHYRRREKNTHRKVGNLKDFCDRWGTGYDYMLVLDADSIMSGETILNLTRMLDNNPNAGLIQAQPRAMGQKTLFGRLTQFNIRLTGELFSTGLSYWTLNDGNYWGHNAILRLKPFMEHCNLPTLSGKGPLSGDILSHDFVEAAWLRRAGYDVWIFPEGKGSYEQIPTNILDHIIRDQRWCQGNFQHTRLLGTKGLKPISRLHMLMGVMSYASSYLWMLLLVLSALLVTERTMPLGPVLELPAEWPSLQNHIMTPLSLFTVVMGMLFMPKIFALIIGYRDAKAYGGVIRITLSCLLEMTFSAITAPVVMIFHVRIITALLLGKTVQWNAQSRSGRNIPWSEAFKQHSAHLLAAAGLGAVYYLQAPELLPWLAPILTGLIISAPLAVAFGQEKIGLFLLNQGLLLIPEETRPPEELPILFSRFIQPSLLANDTRYLPKAAE
ncbi:glucans biosynthesis glucosyltransferase MdoH [Kiloniella laminariae]|uniref:glucans biosynthesis glucosyltransferase MdoH n=1 Tax=Kiloniella laminariae TaxID=454162 RepID=UPI0012F89464|nr:glucans biosynthesis glucosyltransferase MdoH [Kiloniella laminariae]